MTDMSVRDMHTHHYYCVLGLVNGREDGRDNGGESATIFLDSSETLQSMPHLGLGSLGTGSSPWQAF